MHWAGPSRSSSAAATGPTCSTGSTSRSTTAGWSAAACWPSGADSRTVAVDIDTAVANPARGVRLPGTWNRKGDGTADRPHRRVRVVDPPEAIEIVPSRPPEALASEAGETPTDTAPRPTEATRTVQRLAYAVSRLAPRLGLRRARPATRSSRAACALIIDFDLSKDRAWPILASWNERKAVPPWDDAGISIASSTRPIQEARRDRSRPGRAAAPVGPGGRRTRRRQPLSSVPQATSPSPGRSATNSCPCRRCRRRSSRRPFRAWLADIADAGRLPARLRRRRGDHRRRRPWSAARSRSAPSGTTTGPSWPNLWGGVVGRPGELKTPALEEAMRPLRRLVEGGRGGVRTPS